MTRLAFFFAPFILMLSGCQQAAWKAGASADDFRRDELACQELKGDNAATAQCLRGKGWRLAEFNNATNDNEETDVSVGSEKPAPLNESVREKQIAPAPSPATIPSAKPTENIEKAAAKNNPLQKQSVQTWWKAGAHAPDFQVDIDGCLAQLGDQHAPDYSKRLYTRATINCLRERGWYAGSGPTYTPLR